MNQEDSTNDDFSSMSSSQSDLSEESDSFKNFDDTNDLDVLYHNKQVETLKHLRQLLSENKILKKRLNLVEAELEQYQEFRGIIPLKDLVKDSDEESEINEDLLKTTEDKQSQTELISDSHLNHVPPQQIPFLKQEPILEPSKTPPKAIQTPAEEQQLNDEKIEIKKKPEQILRDVSNQFLKSTIIEPAAESYKPSKSKSCKNKSVKINDIPQVEIINSFEVIKANKKTQTENDILYAKQIIELNEQIDLVKKEKGNELAQVNMANLELKMDIENLKRKIESSVKDYEAISDKFNEYRLMNMDSDHEVILLKEKNIQLQYEVDSLEKQLQTKEEQLTSRQNEIDILKENNKMLKESSKIIDKQQKQIEYLLAENEKHLKEKHIICQQKISELTNECNSYAEFIKTQNQEMKNQLDHINRLNLEIGKLKSEQQSFNFKEFINLKRELNYLKQEKERKFAEEVIQPNSISNTLVIAQQPLPPIKENKKGLFKFFN